MTELSTTQARRPYTDFENNTYIVVSKVAYMLGVPVSIFENIHEPPQLDWLTKLDQDRNARIIRDLCLLRTALLNNHQAVNSEIKYNLKNLHSLPRLVPAAAIERLSKDGITIVKANCTVDEYLLTINGHIQNRINNCKSIFPIWLNWQYIRTLFIMPNGAKLPGLRDAQTEFYRNRSYYPYQVYLNWPSTLNHGNILYNDKKFVSLLYEVNFDCFYDLSKVSDAGNVTKSGVYQFLEQSQRTAIVVDCENVDPYKLYATLNNLNQAALLDKVVKIILYDDIHTSTGWQILNQFTQIPIEHVMVDRVKEDKSLVDIRLTTGTCREFFQNHTDSFILASSDSDYWGLISSMPETRFLVLVEEIKCSPTVKRAMEDAGITYCHMDDFCTGNSDAIRIQAVLNEVKYAIDEAVDFNINDILENACTVARANMSETEKRQFYGKYIKSMRLVVAEDGAVSIKLGGE